MSKIIINVQNNHRHHQPYGSERAEHNPSLVEKQQGGIHFEDLLRLRSPRKGGESDIENINPLRFDCFMIYKTI